MQDIILNIRKSLSDFYPDTEISGLIRLLIENVTKSSIPALLSDKSKKITEEELLKIDKIVERLQNFEPIQYILGETEFYGLPFVVNENVLIPRPETEELVELILKENKTDQPRILDIGTGSGCIAISLKKYLLKSIVEGWDISKGALEVANLNSKNNSANVLFTQVDILGEYPNQRTFDIIVSNPPYVLDSEKSEMHTNVLKYEPHTALFVADNNPLVFYNRIADVATQLLTNGGKLYFEINRMKGQETVKMLEDKGFSNTQLIKDISGNNRIVKAEYHKVE
ncbi:peptide chain release factor N(5)-glutamine methyltransferase [Dysgonomonas sp. GY617]|uniref:peptide chain release factor N(5)-glutamine methyltransferase n=1 Tax=Dysgonomonas sp. GY617 TaxID=2780420 RepID=UPI001883FF4A|nr:peptide chain release factor N(5)-glutamine methyltransferase [Dysgonomonas sp. GY617]MBF0576668.1 peptide chain release factor N(5)-glutamine methyltransferase [Dysgonomonas sp. GY617]